MRAFLLLFLLAGCSAAEDKPNLGQLDVDEDGDVSIEERHQPARDAMIDSSRSVRDRYEEAIEWCHGEFAMASYCNSEVAQIARETMAKELVRHRETAEFVNEHQAEIKAEECTEGEQFNRRFGRVRQSELLYDTSHRRAYRRASGDDGIL